MKATILLLVLLLLSLRFAHAQGVAVAAPPPDSLIKVSLVPSGRYTHVLYTLNDEPLTNSTIKTLLGKYPQSALELRRFKAQRRTALLLLPVYLASMTVGLVQTYPQRTEPGSLFSKAPVPFSLALGALFGSLAVSATNDHYEKAIEAYNAAAKARRR